MPLLIIDPSRKRLPAFGLATFFKLTQIVFRRVLAVAYALAFAAQAFGIFFLFYFLVPFSIGVQAAPVWGRVGLDSFSGCKAGAFFFNFQKIDVFIAIGFTW